MSYKPSGYDFMHMEELSIVVYEYVLSPRQEAKRSWRAKELRSWDALQSLKVSCILQTEQLKALPA